MVILDFKNIAAK